MKTKLGKRFAMNAAALTRSAVTAMVERHERLTGSRMTAYHMVAQTIGTSAEWVRSYVSKTPRTKEPSFPIGLNILSAYDRLCNRVEQMIEQERRQVAQLREETNAVTEIVDRMVARETREDSDSTGED